MKLARPAVVGCALMVLLAGTAPAWSSPTSQPDHLRLASPTHAQERSSGNLGPSKLWNTRFNGSIPSPLTKPVAVTPDGAMVFVAGATTPPQGQEPDYQTVAYDAASGAQLWMATYDGPGHGSDSPAAISVSPDGGTVYVTGSSAGAGTAGDYATVAYDVLTGDELWVARYDGPHVTNLGDGASSVTVSPDGGSVFVTGSSDADDRFATVYATVAYDAATGAERWVARYGGLQRGTNAAYGIAVSPDGSRVFVTGYSPGGSSQDDYATVAYDASTGSGRWVARYTSNSGLDLDFAYSIAVAPDGSAVVVTGESDHDYATVAYDPATGSQRWVARYAGGDVLNHAAAVAVGPGSRSVYVTGQTCCTTGSNDLLTVAYDLATGEERWVAPYDLAGLSDFGASIALSPDGTTVFVAGTATPVEGTQEWATVAYVAGSGQERGVLTVGGRSPGAASPIGLAISSDGSRLFVTGSVKAGFGTIGYQLR
jgi:DNA-binding beta-propeller fold protein YncE